MRGLTAGRAEEGEEDDVGLFAAVLEEDVDGLDHLVAGAHDRVHEQHLAVGDVLGELGVEDARLSGLLLAVHQDLADADRAAAVAQSLLHRLAAPHDADAAVALLVLQALVGRARWR